jgi:uncharacterized protein
LEDSSSLPELRPLHHAASCQPERSIVFRLRNDTESKDAYKLNGSRNPRLVLAAHCEARSILRLRNCFAKRSSPFAQDDSLEVRAKRYNSLMSLSEQIQKDIITAMKAREEHRLSTLRMVKSALKNREIEKMAPLDDKESQQVLTTLIKQRKDSVEQFTKGGRQEMADKEAAEIVLIEAYMPKAAGQDQVVAGVRAVIAEMGAPTMKEMGTVMKNVMARFAGAGIRVDGKQVSDAVRQELAGK